jgi:thiol-disulfide isomerase/thioredoxin
MVGDDDPIPGSRSTGDTMHKPLLSTGALLLALALTGCASDDADSDAAAVSPAPATTSAAAVAPSESPSQADAAQATPEQGSWVDQATYAADPAAYHEAGDVVLFFNADWCPTCRTTVENLDAEGVPPGLTVVSVDFDSSSDLRKQYGVTVQHTFVQVDPVGKEQAVFTGALTGEQIAAQLA